MDISAYNLVFFSLLLIPDFISPAESLKKCAHDVSIKPHIFIRFYFHFYFSHHTVLQDADIESTVMQVWCH